MALKSAATRPRKCLASERSLLSSPSARRPRSCRVRAARAAPNQGPSDTATEHEQLTQRFVAASSVPFTVLVLPQVLQNYVNITHGNVAAVAAVSWLGYAAGLAGNCLMCVHLASRGEATAVNVQLIGIASNLVVLAQLWYAAVMPTAALAAALVAALAVGALGVLRARGTLSPRAWLPFELLVSAVGVVTVPQVLWSAFAPGSPSVLPSALAVVAVGQRLRQAAAASPAALQAAVASLPGWCATCMFALSPVPQLVRNFLNLSGVGGLSQGTVLLATAGNALCIPRALYARDAAWTFGTTWGVLSMGWGNLLCCFLGRSPETGARFLGELPFAAFTIALALYLAAVVSRDTRAKGLAGPLSSYPDAFGGAVGGGRAAPA